jgi:hypothetical protein
MTSGTNPPAYNANNFMLPMISASQQLMQQFQQNPNSIMAAFSPAAFQQMSSFFPSQMAVNPLNQTPGGPTMQPTPGAPASPGGFSPSVVEPFNPPQAAPPQQPQQPQQPAAPTNGIFIPEYGSYIQPWQMQQMLATGSVPPEVESQVAYYLENLYQQQPWEQRKNDPWDPLYYQWTTRG